MSKILISGYYGFKNAGDDSVLFGIITSLKKSDPSLHLGVLSNDPETTKEMFSVNAYNRWNLFEVFKRIKEHDLLLMGGGSLLQDATSPRSVLYYLGLVFAAKTLRKPVVFYAQGVGPITNRSSKKLIKYIVNKVDVITVRDIESGDDLKEFGVKAPIIVTADPAVTIRPETIDLNIGKSLLSHLKIDGNKTMAISVRDWKKERKYYTQIAKVADHYASQGWNICFLAMQYPDDVNTCKEIIHLMKNKATIIDKQLNFKEIMSVIGNVRFVLGMRLHSVIFSAVMNIPFVAISYDPKIERFVERINMTSAGHIQNLDHKKVITMVDDVINNEEFAKNQLLENIDYIIDYAEKSSQLTIDLLNSNEKRT